MKIEIVPLSVDHSRSVFDGSNPLKSKRASLRAMKKEQITRKKKDKFEARHMFHLPSGNIVTAFERGSTTLQAKKRLMRLLGPVFFH